MSESGKRTKRLPARLLAPFASAAMPAAALGVPLSVYLPNYYASHIGLSLASVGLAFTMVRLIDILFDPLIGVAINATRTPFINDRKIENHIRAAFAKAEAANIKTAEILISNFQRK